MGFKEEFKKSGNGSRLGVFSVFRSHSGPEHPSFQSLLSVLALPSVNRDADL